MPDMNGREQIYDQWLVQRCQEGDARAFDELMSRWQERLWRHAVRLTGDTDAAWDILQETMLAISGGLGRLVEPAAFPGWAYRIATNRCRALFRRNRSRRQSLEAYLESQPVEIAPDAAAALDLQAALKKLSHAQQTLVSLRYEEGFSVGEIAGILGIQPGTVKSRLYAARQQLRALLEEPEP